MKLNGNIKIFVNYFLGPLLFAWLAWSIYKQITHQPNLGDAWTTIQHSFHTTLVWNLVIVVLLMIVNWSIEAIKWKISVYSVQPVSFIKAFMAVLSGVSFSVSTPNRVGEYLGRVLYMEEGNRLRTISITIVGSMSQLIITLAMGVFSLVLLQDEIIAKGLISSPWIHVIIYGSLGALLVLTLFYFRLSWLTRRFDRLPGATRFVYLVRALEDFNATLLLRLLSLSALRFAVFIIQYYLLFRLFGVELDAGTTFLTVSVSFLVMAAIPTIAIVELVQRGKVVGTLVGLFSANELGMNLATASIWCINLIIPAIIGSLLILSIKKIFRNKK